MTKIKIKRYNTKRRRNEKNKWMVLLTATVVAVIMIATSYLANITPTQVLAHDLVNNDVKHTETPVIADLSVLKGTQMEESIPYILKASDYYGIPVELYLGIAFAESSFNNFPVGSYNPVGLKPNNRLKNYSDWEHSVNFWFHLIKEYYWEEGKQTCKQIERKYLGYFSSDWVNNCLKYYK